ncbi:D-glycero-beta-D-manno-heptose 1,7-bisphosphate 7-phosphatase [Thiorhodospira sibirica]|uniref:D-glycero-beta-D-manno-heptose 1,7-bisphosphate 7-phosphatase n=1 Tax=Thiorhodospira sibirica TaxID=154347 RepID=UPI00022C0AD2|nr:D-glycero-beta-D-manno-heptose 1,7-bisphosphate 7-phosphatase [Thiorhodospira sibirica]
MTAVVRTPLPALTAHPARLVILDRDGVINHDSDAYIKSVAEWVPIPGSLEAIVRLSQAGFRVVIATNQSGVARGLLSLHTLHEIHATLQQMIATMGGQIAGIFYCPHGPQTGCRCRKPLPGLFEQIQAHFAVNLHGVAAVGDALRDLQCAAAMHCQPILVRTGKGQQTLARLGGAPSCTRLVFNPCPDEPSTTRRSARVFDDLAAVADELLHAALVSGVP